MLFISVTDLVLSECFIGAQGPAKRAGYNDLNQRQEADAKTN